MLFRLAWPCVATQLPLSRSCASKLPSSPSRQFTTRAQPSPSSLPPRQPQRRSHISFATSHSARRRQLTRASRNCVGNRSGLMQLHRYSKRWTAGLRSHESFGRPDHSATRWASGGCWDCCSRNRRAERGKMGLFRLWSAQHRRGARPKDGGCTILQIQIAWSPQRPPAFSPDLHREKHRPASGGTRRKQSLISATSPTSASPQDAKM